MAGNVTMTHIKRNSSCPKLLAPAGDWPSLMTAIDSGADSVYFGVKGMNMRNLADNFDLLEIKKVMRTLKDKGKEGYLALNVFVRDRELPLARKILEEAKRSGVDGVILWDMGVFATAKELGLPIHLSTQASVTNFAALRAYAELGAERVVLGRECTLDQIREIVRERNESGISCRIEAFIHGAMCVSVSGRCFLSAYSYGTSANKGECHQPCRREYTIKEIDGDTEYVLGQDYLLSPKDLCTMGFLDQLIDAGIDAFKVEGRMRSPEYLRVVVSSYRRAIDAHAKGELTEGLKQALLKDLGKVYHRGFSNGFYFGRPEGQISRGLEHRYERVYVGEVARFFPRISVAEVKVFNEGLRVGGEIVIVGKKTAADPFTVEEIQRDRAAVSRAQKKDIVGIKVPHPVFPRDKVFLWREKGLEKN